MIEELFAPIPEDDGEIDVLHQQGYEPWQILQAVHDAGEKELREQNLRRVIKQLDQ